MNEEKRYNIRIFPHVKCELFVRYFILNLIFRITGLIVLAINFKKGLAHLDPTLLDVETYRQHLFCVGCYVVSFGSFYILIHI